MDGLLILPSGPTVEPPPMASAVDWLTPYSCEPFTASVLVALSVPAARLVITWALPGFVASPPAATSVSLSVVAVRCTGPTLPFLMLVMSVVLPATFWLVAYSCEPFTASVLVALSAPAATLVILLVAEVPCDASYMPVVLFQFRASILPTSPVMLAMAASIWPLFTASAAAVPSARPEILPLSLTVMLPNFGASAICTSTVLPVTTVLMLPLE